MAYAQFTLADLKTDLASRYDASPFWTSEEARRAINESLRSWNRIVGFWRGRISQTVVPGTPWQALPGTMAYRTRIEIAGRPLRLTSLFHMDQARPHWEGELTTAGGSVPTTVRRWMPIGLQLIGIWPILPPTTPAADNVTLTIDGILQTPILNSDRDTVDLGKELVSVLLGCALHLLSVKRGIAAIRATLPFYRAFVLAAGEHNEQFAASSFYRTVMGLDVSRSADRLRRPLPSSTMTAATAAS